MYSREASGDPIWYVELVDLRQMVVRLVFGALPLSYRRIGAASRIRTDNLPIGSGCSPTRRPNGPYRHRARLCAVHQSAPYWNTRGVEPPLSGYDVVLNLVGMSSSVVGRGTGALPLSYAPIKRGQKDSNLHRRFGM
jgi:hypothetical protein